MTTGWGAGPWGAPRAAWLLARDAAAGSGDAAAKDIAPGARPGVIIALGTQIRSFAADAALHGNARLPDPGGWERDVPCAGVRRLCADALAGGTVRVPGKLCARCTAAAAVKMAGALAGTMRAAGVPDEDLLALLDWLASRARQVTAPPPRTTRSRARS